jgi:hypothetical protein
MISPQGMDELLWGREHEDVSDWVERLTMAAEVRDLNVDKLFKIAKLNLRGQAREWLRRLQPAPADWTQLRTLILHKYGNVDDMTSGQSLMPLSRNPESGFRGISNGWTDFSRKAEYRMPSKKGGF